MILLLKNVSSTLIVRFFVQKIQFRKFLNLENLENLKNLLKKSFRPFERHFKQNLRAENIPVVAGRLVVLFK